MTISIEYKDYLKQGSLFHLTFNYQSEQEVRDIYNIYLEEIEPSHGYTGNLDNDFVLAQCHQYTSISNQTKHSIRSLVVPFSKLKEILLLFGEESSLDETSKEIITPFERKIGELSQLIEDYGAIDIIEAIAENSAKKTVLEHHNKKNEEEIAFSKDIRSLRNTNGRLLLDISIMALRDGIMINKQESEYLSLANSFLDTVLSNKISMLSEFEKEVLNNFLKDKIREATNEYNYATKNVSDHSPDNAKYGGSFEHRTKYENCYVPDKLKTHQKMLTLQNYYNSLSKVRNQND